MVDDGSVCTTWPLRRGRKCRRIDDAAICDRSDFLNENIPCDTFDVKLYKIGLLGIWGVVWCGRSEVVIHLFRWKERRTEMCYPR